MVQGAFFWCFDWVQDFLPTSPLYSLRSLTSAKIAQPELSMISFRLLARPANFRGERGIWYGDNLAAPMPQIRWRSDVADLAPLSPVIHVVLLAVPSLGLLGMGAQQVEYWYAIYKEGELDFWRRRRGFSTPFVSEVIGLLKGFSCTSRF